MAFNVATGYPVIAREGRNKVYRTRIDTNDVTTVAVETGLVNVSSVRLTSEDSTSATIVVAAPTVTVTGLTAGVDIWLEVAGY